MKLISWNVNGLRACVNKNFMEDFKKLDADIFCLQLGFLQTEEVLRTGRQRDKSP